MRCYPPRRSRVVWIFFLLFVCLIGVYFAYKNLNDAESYQISKQSSPNIHDAMRSHPKKHKKVPLEKPNEESLFEAKQMFMPDSNNAVLVDRNTLNDEDYITNEEMMSRLKRLVLDLSPSNWKTAADVDEMILQVKSELMDLEVDSKMSCREINSLKDGLSRYKNVYGKVNIDFVKVDFNSELVLKSVGQNHQLKTECMQMDYNEERCRSMGNYKLLRELVYMVILDSPAVISIKGFCLRGETIDNRIPMKGVIIVTEPGNKINTDSTTFFPYPWQTKLEMCVTLLKLLLYMEDSPIGILGFDQLHLPDFVMISSSDDVKIKLVDLDNIHVGELSCDSQSQCSIPEMAHTNIECTEGLCQGHNAKKNLLMLYKTIIFPMLNNQPIGGVSKMEQEKFLSSIGDLTLSTKEVIQQMEAWLGKGIPPVTPAPKIIPDLNKDKLESNNKPQEEAKSLRNKNLGPNEYLDRNGMLRQKNPDQFVDKFGVLRSNTTPKPVTAKPVEESTKKVDMNKDTQNSQKYIRHNNLNFPGKYDYKCPASRTSWGCVVSVTTLDEAQAICTRDVLCKAFVIFSTHPENGAYLKDEVLQGSMTVVLKNAKDLKPEPNYGATLFVKDNNVGNEAARPVAKDNEVSHVTTKAKVEMDLPTCLKKVLNQTENARVARERRLLTHLGLKDVVESDWIKYAKSVKIVKNLGKSQMSSKDPTGGRFKVGFEQNAAGLKKGELMVEKGETNYHIGYLVAYYTDRTLGLYHIPPSIQYTLPVSEFKALVGTTKWRQQYATLNFSDSSGVTGVLTAPVPPVMKVEKLMIDKLEGLVSDVVPFTRNQRVQLEYILLWNLVKMMQPQHGFFGYKGHLIHFEADLSFMNLKKSLLGYLYNCQFPNTVYKTLICYKCPDSHRMPRICGLGQEVIEKVIKSGFSKSDIRVGTLSHNDLVEVINNSASSVVSVVEQCIKTFTREKVLY